MSAVPREQVAAMRELHQRFDDYTTTLHMQMHAGRDENGGEFVLDAGDAIAETLTHLRQLTEAVLYLFESLGESP